MPVMPLKLSPDYEKSIKPFLDSLFLPDVRSIDIVVSATQGGGDTVSFSDASSRKIVLESWLAAWKVASGDTPGDWKSYIRTEDQSFITFLAGYIGEHELDLCKRSLAYTSSSIDPQAPGVPFYSNTEYERFSFKKNGIWSYGNFNDEGEPLGDGTVTSFLWLLFHGAHIVVINVSGDGATGMSESFDTTFNDSFDGDQRSACPGNSHYGGAYGTDDYYLDIGHKVPDNPPFILALLVGDTSSGDSNGFLQLEGWQAQSDQDLHGGPRHHFDYQTHDATVWNISTFGASGYSEKRCTTIFLAQSGFDLSIDPKTHMPLYDGAGSIQGWMSPGYITGGALDEVLADVHDDPGHLYLFQETQLIHYDPSAKKMHANYPQPIENIFPGLSAKGFGSIDAAYGVPRNAKKNGGTYYFFKGDNYLHYDPSQPKDQRAGSLHKITGDPDNSEHWPGLGSQGFTTIDAVAYGPSSDGKNDKIHFFKGSRYCRFDVTSNSIDHGATLDFQLADAAPQSLCPGAAEFVSNRLLLFQNDEAVAMDLNSFTIDTSWGAAAIYGTNLFPGLWWTPTPS